MFEAFLLLIPLLPLTAAVITAALGYTILREKSYWPCVLGSAGSCVLSIMVFLHVMTTGNAVGDYYTWFQAGGVDIGFNLRADRLTAIMLVTVTFVGSLIVVYSIGYMKGEQGYPRYFAQISLFLFSMTGLVLANNFILLYAFWEGVGLCSYLLIGFWYTKPSAAAAARKAFLVTRLGDIGLFVGILLLWLNAFHLNVFPEQRTLDISTFFELLANEPDTYTGVYGEAICLLLFCGAVGKSAQFPLHVWLPDAMEGPTPVSALIHAATMVTAGVYLVARCIDLFVLNEVARVTVACVGTGTALLAALIAVTQTDLKRVLAYSTISQLGFMFLALGGGINDRPGVYENLAETAVTAAIFHLFTHAFFKALLFLGSGSVMHAMGNVSDMRRFGGLRKVLPVTHWTFLCGAAALAGVPLLSGFWSKDQILESALQASLRRPGLYGALFSLALLTAGLTAFYTFRAYFLTFWGATRIPPEAKDHVHESPVMLGPLRILAVGALVLGVLLGPTGIFFGLLYDTTPRFHVNLGLIALSVLVVVPAIGLAYWMYVENPRLPAEVARFMRITYAASQKKFLFDEIYTALFVKPLSAFAHICRVLDQYIVDGLVDLLAHVPAFLGWFVRPVQNGLVQFYALWIALGVTGFLLAVLLR